MRYVTGAVVVCVVGLMAVPAAAEARERKGRVVELVWDIAKDSPAEALTVRENCGGNLAQCAVGGRELKGLAAFSYELNDRDRITLVLKGRIGEEQVLVAKYAITGTNVNDKAREDLKNVFKGTQDKAKAGATGGALGVAADTIEMVAVTDGLPAGGRLTATFKLIGRDAAGKETVIASPEPVVFRIERRNPKFVMTYGLAIVNGASPAVEIIKTSTVVKFTKDGKEQQAFESAIHLKDAETAMRPIETAVAFLNFRLPGDRVYASLGFPTNETVFTQPLLGLSARIPLGDSLGIMFTGGVRFTKELAIAAASGFKDGDRLDPTLGLTVGDITTEPTRRRRFFFSLSFDF